MLISIVSYTDQYRQTDCVITRVCFKLSDPYSLCRSLQKRGPFVQMRSRLSSRESHPAVCLHTEQTISSPFILRIV